MCYAWFIFLTPKSWFASSPHTQTTVVLGAEPLGQADKAEIGRRAKRGTTEGQVWTYARARRRVKTDMRLTFVDQP
jgi:hypothetical protein